MIIEFQNHENENNGLKVYIWSCYFLYATAKRRLANLWFWWNSGIHRISIYFNCTQLANKVTAYFRILFRRRSQQWGWFWIIPFFNGQKFISHGVNLLSCFQFWLLSGLKFTMLPNSLNTCIHKHVIMSIVPGSKSSHRVQMTFGPKLRSRICFHWKNK